jgi:hypothetical protein
MACRRQTELGGISVVSSPPLPHLLAVILCGQTSRPCWSPAPSLVKLASEPHYLHPRGRLMDNRHFLCTPSCHRPTLAPLSKVFSLAAMRISSHTHQLLCGHSATYRRPLCASVRQLSEFMRQLSASIRRPSEPDPAHYAARFGRSETASAEKRQIEHLKKSKKGTFRPKTAPKKFGSGFITRPQTQVLLGAAILAKFRPQPYNRDGSYGINCCCHKVYLQCHGGNYE